MLPVVANAATTTCASRTEIWELKSSGIWLSAAYARTKSGHESLDWYMCAGLFCFDTAWMQKGTIRQLVMPEYAVTHIRTHKVAARSVGWHAELAIYGHRVYIPKPFINLKRAVQAYTTICCLLIL